MHMVLVMNDTPHHDYVSCRLQVQVSVQTQDSEVKAYFETLGLDIWDAWSFFKLLDLDGGRHHFILRGTA